MSSAIEAVVALHRRGAVAAARQAAESALAASPDDGVLLHFLGMLEAREGRLDRARHWLERACVIRGAGVMAMVSLARVLTRSSDWARLADLDFPMDGAPGEELLSLRARAREAVGRAADAANDLSALSARRPDDIALALAAAAAQADAEQHGQAEIDYRRALAINPANERAVLGITGLLESLSRPGALAPIFAAAKSSGASPALLALGDAIALREAKSFDAALPKLAEAKALLPAGTFEQMRGELADRAGETELAYASFAAMNDAEVAASPNVVDGMRRFRATIEEELATLENWEPLSPPPETRPAPLFLVGFPRSGTTLLDTYLMGSPDVELHEERQFLQEAAMAGGSGPLTSERLATMRSAYWAALDAETDRRDALQVDKNPLATARARLIHALFPDARFLLALRHPCDVVLSCFMTRFRLNAGVASFVTLADAAASYDLVMSVWVKARDRLGLNVHEIRYEELITNPSHIIKGAADFAGFSMTDAMLDHQTTARQRGYVATPSHAQITQPLYKRAAGRWQRYRAQMAPVLPILAPWCDRFGYAID